MTTTGTPNKNPFWQYEPDELAEPPERANLLRVFAGKECQRHIELFERHNDPVHLWKAWRCARACGPLPATVIEHFIPLIDRLAATGLASDISVRLRQREERDWILRDYKYEKDVRDAMRRDPETKAAALNLTQIYKRVAARHKTTAGRVEQLILSHEGRDGRSKTSKSHQQDS